MPIMEELAGCLFKFLEGFVVVIFDDFLFEELPESFDQAEVW